MSLVYLTRLYHHSMQCKLSSLPLTLTLPTSPSPSPSISPSISPSPSFSLCGCVQVGHLNSLRTSLSFMSMTYIQNYVSTVWSWFSIEEINIYQLHLFVLGLKLVPTYYVIWRLSSCCRKSATQLGIFLTCHNSSPPWESNPQRVRQVIWSQRC